MTDIDLQAPVAPVEVRVLRRAFARLDKVALGVALGLTVGAILALATAWLLVRGGRVVGPTLSLLGQYFPGYEVSWGGVLFGLLYGFLAGFLTGWGVAWLRNATIHVFLSWARHRGERALERQFLDYV